MAETNNIHNDLETLNIAEIILCIQLLAVLPEELFYELFNFA